MTHANSHLARKEATLEEILRLLDNHRLHNLLHESGRRRPTNLSIHLSDPGVAFVEVAGVWWGIVDNGGELTLERLNHYEIARRVPLYEWAGPVNAATLAMRVAAVLRDEEIDYETVITNDRLAGIFSDVRA